MARTPTSKPKQQVQMDQSLLSLISALPSVPSEVEPCRLTCAAGENTGLENSVSLICGRRAWNGERSTPNI